MNPRFTPRLNALPTAQRALWVRLRQVRELGYVLYGGTALALRLGHRQSVDFDFFTDRPLDIRELVDRISFIEYSTVLQSERDTYTILVPEDDAHVKVSFFGSIDFGRVGEPEVSSDEVIAVASYDDLLATKLKVLMQRVEAKDYVDIAALISGGVDLAVGLAATSALFGKQFSPSDCLRALEYFEEPGLSDLDDSVKSTIHRAVTRVLSLEELPIIDRISERLI
jgi:hypothetical protein